MYEYIDIYIYMFMIIYIYIIYICPTRVGESPGFSSLFLSMSSCYFLPPSRPKTKLGTFRRFRRREMSWKRATAGRPARDSMGFYGILWDSMENGGFNGILWDFMGDTLWLCQNSYGKLPFIAIENGDFPQLC